MEYIFFWASAVTATLLFAIAVKWKGISLPVWIIGISSIAYSMVYEIFLSDRLGLYHYITPGESTAYVLLGAFFIYTPLNLVYILFLPESRKNILIYTIVWSAAMLALERASVLTHTVVFTGWEPMPWSIVTYAVTYAWIILFYKYLMRLPHRQGFSH